MRRHVGVLTYFHWNDFQKKNWTLEEFYFLFMEGVTITSGRYIRIE